MRTHFCRAILLLGLSCAVVAAAPAQTDDGTESDIPWQKGPTIGKLGRRAEVKVPEDCGFVDEKGVVKLLEATQNIAQGNELGGMVCSVPGSESYWMVFFSFDDVGYIKDDEKDQLDADKLLASLRENTERANEIRAERGWGGFHVTGWERAPYYDSVTHNLTWAIRGEDDENQSSLNHNVRLLGREGVMSVELVVSPDNFAASMQGFETVLAGFNYGPGNRYSEWRQGDKVATYGLTALVAGGAGAMAAKSGLLGKLWKVIVAGAVALAAAVKKLFNKLTGKEDTQSA
jgi:uncharacterized membrane-anchored protein